MNNDRNKKNQPQEQDDLLREGRRDDESINLFEQVRQNLNEDNTSDLEEEAETEQQHKDAMTERD